MKMYCLSFTDRGEKLAEKLTDDFGAYADRCNRGISLKKWTEKAFKEADTVVFIGACIVEVVITRIGTALSVDQVASALLALLLDDCGSKYIRADA